MHNHWTRHLKDPKKIEEFKQYLANSLPVLRRVASYIETKRKGRTPLSSDYDNPSWAYKQADRNGYMRALKELEEFINLNDQREEK